MNTHALKSKILDLLIRGELTAKWRQEHKDIESADVLLESIRQEKEKKLNDELIAKKKKPTVKVEIKEVPENDKPFEIPPTWKWCRLEDVATKLVDGDHNPPAGVTQKTDYIMASSRNINNNRLVALDLVRYLTKEVFEKENERTNATKGDILFTSVGALGRSCIYDGSLNICFQRSVSVVRTLICNEYVKYCLDSPYNQIFIMQKATGTAQKGFYLNQLEKLVIPLPPLEEQKEIARIAQSFMTMIDEVESSYSSIEDLSKKAKTKILDLLIKGELTAKWREEHKDIESADVLLESIRQEKEKKLNDELIAKKKKPTVKVEIKEVPENDKPFEIPPTWKWVYFGDIFQHNTGKTQNSSIVTKNGIIKPFITTSNLYWNKFDFTKVKKMAFSSSELEKYTARKGDLLICEGGDFGRSAIWKYDYSVCFQNHIHRVRAELKDSVEIDFYYYVMFLFKNTGRIDGHGVGIQGLSTNKLHKLVIPLPPLEEQKEMVRIADKLLSQIDSLVQIDSISTGEDDNE